MSILGKFLTVLNFLALLGFLALGVMTLQKRTTWAHAVMRYEIALDGLPVDNETDLKGQPRVDNLSDTVLKDLLGETGVRTQMQELKKFESKLKADIDNPEVAKGQTREQKQAWVLMRMATSLDDRQNLLALWSYEANPNKNAVPQQERERLEKIKAGLDDRINALFSESTLGGTPTPGADGSKPLAGQELAHKKRAIARVLVSLHDVFPEQAAGQNPDAAKDPFTVKSYQRVLAVCGARAVAQELEFQARFLADMADRMNELVEQDRLAFADVHQLLLYQVMDKAQQLGRVQLTLQDQTARARVQEAKAKEQEDKVKDVTAKLDTAISTTDKELARIAKLQERLFKTRLDLRDANAQNQQLEQEIRRLERQTGRPGRTRPPVPGEAQP